MLFLEVWPLRESSQSNRSEEVDGEASVSGIITRKETFKERLQGPVTHAEVMIYCYVLLHLRAL